MDGKRGHSAATLGQDARSQIDARSI